MHACVRACITDPPRHPRCSSPFNRDHVTLEDLEGFTTEKDAKAAMDMLDGDGNGMVNVQVRPAALSQRDRRLAASRGVSGVCHVHHAATSLTTTGTSAPLLLPPQECCAAIATMFVERSNLAASLKDARTIVGKLETVRASGRGTARQRYFSPRQQRR